MRLINTKRRRWRNEQRNHIVSAEHDYCLVIPDMEGDREMKLLYIVRNEKGEIINEGTSEDIEEYLHVSKSQLRGLVIGSTLKVTVEAVPYRKPEKAFRKKEDEEETLEEMVKRHIILYGNVAIGRESADRVQEIIRHLADDGIVLEARKGAEGWIFQRKSLKKS